MEVASIIASIVSLIVGFVAIALAAYFYTQSKNIEREVSNALASIQAQTEALQKLTGRWMDRLTRYATEARPSEGALVQLARAVVDMPANIASQLRSPEAGSDTQALRNELISTYIAIYYYVAITNFAMQGYLPALESLQQGDIYQSHIDQSYSDFNYMDNLVASLDPAAVRANPLNRLYNATVTTWKPLVRNSTLVYQQRQSSRQ